MAVRASIRVDGMSELRAGLRTIDDGIGREVGKTNRAVGTQVAALTAVKIAELSGRYPAYKSDYVKVRASASQRQVQVTIPGAAEIGIARHPVYGNWVSQTAMRRRVWPPPNAGSGYVVKPTVEDNDELIAGTYLAAIESLVRRTI